MAEGDESDNENQNQSRLNNSLKYFQDHLEDQVIRDIKCQTDF